MGFGNERKNVSEEANIVAIAKRRNPMKVLLFLYQNYKNEKLMYIQEIADLLDMCWETVSCSLYKLNDANLVELVQTNVDKRLKFWRVSNEELVEKAIEKYKYRASFRLARFVPYKRITTEDFKSDKRFIETCQYYGLSISEGISAVLSCPKIEVERIGFPHNQTYLHRKSEGYIPPTIEHEEKPSTKHEREPERTPKQILEEGRKAIE